MEKAALGSFLPLFFLAQESVSARRQHAAGEEEHRAPAPVPGGSARGGDERAGVCHQQHAGCHHQAAGQPQ